MKFTSFNEDDKYRFLRHLKINCCGKENAWTGERLKKALGFPTVKIRAMKHELVVQDHEPVGATTDSGYFYIMTEEELDHCLADTTSRIGALSELKNALEYIGQDFQKEYVGKLF